MMRNPFSRNTALALCAALLLVLFASQARAQAPTQNYRDSLQLRLSEISQQTNLPGFAVGIVNPEGIVYEDGFGYANLEKKTKFTPQTIENIGSVSKTLIGVSIMQLVDAGKLTLETKINDILPFKVVHPRFPHQEITVWQLATHTAGIVDGDQYNQQCYVLLEDFVAGGQRKDEKQYFRRIKKNVERPMRDFLADYLVPKGKHYKKKNFNKYAPGTHYAYTNIGATLAALVVEIVAQEPYSDYTKKHILEPLKMHNSGWKLSEIDKGKEAMLYFKDHLPMPKYTLITYPDGGLLSNCHDMSLYLQKMMNCHAGLNSFLQPSSVSEMMKTQFKAEREQSGIFWDVARNGRIGHTGGDPGIFTIMQFDPETKTGYVFLTNIAGFDDQEMLIDFRKIWKAMAKYGAKIKG